MTECRVAGDKTWCVHAIEDIISFSYPLSLTVYGSPTPGPPVGPWGLIVNHLTLTYKRFGWTPLPKGHKKKRLRLGRLEHNTTQFSHGRRVLRSGSPNHVNHRVHLVNLELTTKRLKAFPTKEP
jgi:hypothetical protein